MHKALKAIETTIGLILLVLSYRLGVAITEASISHELGDQLIQELSVCEQQLPRNEYCTWYATPDDQLNILLRAPLSSSESI